MAHPESRRRVDKVRALIFPEIIKKDYLEDLLENSRSASDQTLDEASSLIAMGYEFIHEYSGVML